MHTRLALADDVGEAADPRHVHRRVRGVLVYGATAIMIRRERCANGVASTGTRAMAAPSTRSCATAIGAVEVRSNAIMISVPW